MVCEVRLQILYPTRMDNRNQTFRWERWRAVSAGVMETASFTFLLLIAVRWFDAGGAAKALIAGGVSVGLLLMPFTALARVHPVQSSILFCRQSPKKSICF